MRTLIIQQLVKLCMHLDAEKDPHAFTFHFHKRWFPPLAGASLVEQFLKGMTHESYAVVSLTACKRSALSATVSASMMRSRSPLSTPGMFEKLWPMRWSVMRSCGKL